MKHKTTLKQKMILVISGFVLSVIILEIILRVAGFIYLSSQEQRNRLSLKPENQYRILCLGDSTTAFGQEYAYPRQLERILNQKKPSVHFVLINKGIPGVDTTTILSELRYNLNKYKPDMVIAMMGMDDDAVEYPYKNSLFFKTKNFIKTLRIYKLTKLLLAKMRERDILKDEYLERGRYYLELDHFREAEEMLKKAEELSPLDPLIYIARGWYYYKQGMFNQAGQMFERAKELASDNEMVYIALGWYYCETGSYALAEKMFKKAIEIKPNNHILYSEAGQFYQTIQRNPESEAMFKKAIELAPNKDSAYSELGWFYYEQGFLDKAEAMFKKAIEISQRRLPLFRDLGFVKDFQGKSEEAKFYFRKIITFTEYFQRITRRNYRVLKDIVLKKGIKLVCVQYPMRKLEDLKSFFDSSAGITFVDNEYVFKEAVQKNGYDYYFGDRCGGDFGHATDEGNRLLANNIAEVLLREYFSK